MMDNLGVLDKTGYYKSRDGLTVVSSMAWRKGNKAEIIIDGVDYPTNIRGDNIVIYDKK